ncbi:hypothetical protein [Actinoplanes sp. URMC 104]|uniref:hypothetical protein n=1 Tax=Actinoplanes sp. URMC 104 TaxID=3423409 RepID=UPI003F1DE8A5
MMEQTRARYRCRAAWLVFPLLIVGSVAFPVVAIFVDAAPWWMETLFLLVAIPLGWWHALTRMFYGMDLTGTALVLRAPIVRERIPLAELAEIGLPVDEGAIRVTRRDGRSWNVLSGSGLEEFADEVGRAAPHVEVRTGDWPRRLADWFR